MEHILHCPVGLRAVSGVVTLWLGVVAVEALGLWFGLCFIRMWGFWGECDAEVGTVVSSTPS